MAARTWVGLWEVVRVWQDRFDGPIEGELLVHRRVVETPQHNFAVVGTAAHEIAVAVNRDGVYFHGVRIEVLRFGAVVQVQHVDVAEVSTEDNELWSGMRNACEKGA